MIFKISVYILMITCFIHGNYLVYEDSLKVVYSKTKDIDKYISKETIEKNITVISELQNHVLNVKARGLKIENVNVVAAFDSMTIGYYAYGWSFYFVKNSEIVKHFQINKNLYDKAKGGVVESTHDALKKARSFLSKFLGYYGKGNELVDYDSVQVKQIENAYKVRLLGKLKDHVFDSRQVEIDVGTECGGILKYRGNIKSKYDMSYRPKITKGQVLKIVKEDMEKTAVDNYSIGKVYIVYEGFGWPKRWMWSIRIIEERKTEFGLKKYYIDSEDGSVLVRPFESAE